MEFYTLLSLIILSLLLWWYLVTKKTANYIAGVELYNLTSVQNLINNKTINYHLVDVRSPEEYLKGHIPTAINIPSKECNGILPSDDLFILVVVYGNNKREANSVAHTLSEFGYFNVHVTESLHYWHGDLQDGYQP